MAKQSRKEQAKQIEEQMTEAVLKALDEGHLPWTKPWQDGVGPQLLPTSVAGRRYRGMNAAYLHLLSMTNGWTHEWGTYKAWKGKDIQVQKGETGTKVVFIQHHFKDETKDGKTESRWTGMSHRVWTVFNRSQTDAPTVEVIHPTPEEYTAEVQRVLKESGAKVTHGGNRACYSPSGDRITLPVMDAFNSQADWCSTALHELSHWTGHNTRLDRITQGTWGDDAYAFEELVAESASALLCNILGVPVDGLQHSEYIATWGSRIAADPSTVRKAFGQAWKVVDLILDGEKNHTVETV